MENLTISQVSKLYDVTPRMLRHYEKLGLILPQHKEDYAYRLYDENAVKRLQQIIILRKLRIPLKQIATIMQDNEQCQALQIMQDKIQELDEEIASLSKIRSILNTIVLRLNISIDAKNYLNLLEDKALVEIVNTLTLSKSTLKESHLMKDSMNELDKANEQLNKLETVRILLLPPFTVASYHYIGQNPEEKVGNTMSKFIQTSHLYELKPDARLFGFNHPNPGILEDGIHGYEDWVTIPDDMEIPKPLTKKHFAGGLYAALTISFPEFHRWNDLVQWANNNEQYQPNYSEEGDEIMGGCLEEHLNWVYAAHAGWPENGIDGQIDLLLPIKKV